MGAADVTAAKKLGDGRGGGGGRGLPDLAHMNRDSTASARSAASEGNERGRGWGREREPTERGGELERVRETGERRG